MTALKILIVEDEVITALDLRQTLEQAGHQITGIAHTLQEARQSVMDNPPNLAVIDIELARNSSGNGIDTARELLLHHAMPVIYLTANSELTTFQRARATAPAAYLLKPFNAPELLFTVELAYHHFRGALADPPNAPASSYLMLPIGGGLERIDLANVVYLEADGAYAKIFLADGNAYTVSTNLGQLEHYFPAPVFFRLSRSHLVSLNYIKRLKENELSLTSSPAVLPIPASSRRELLRKMTVVRTKQPIDRRY